MTEPTLFGTFDTSINFNLTIPFPNMKFKIGKLFTKRCVIYFQKRCVIFYRLFVGPALQQFSGRDAPQPLT